MERQTTAMSQLASALEKVQESGMDGDKRTDDRRRYHGRQEPLSE